MPVLFATPTKRNLLLSLLLVSASVLIYFPAGNNAFINFDDRQYITDNPHIRAGLSWQTVKWAFTTYDAANWHPLTWLSHALDYQLFGLNPAGHHFVSVLLHAANVVLLFLLLESLTELTWQSFLVAVLFAVHPLNVESVAWAAERKNVLSMFFFLFALLAYYWYVRRPSIARHLGVSGLFALALIAKPQVITLPCVLLLLDYWPLERVTGAGVSSGSAGERNFPKKSFLGLFAEKLPWFALSAISAVITLHAQRAGNAVRSTTEYSLISRFETAITSYVLYLRDVFFPRHLAPIYPHPPNLIPAWKVLLSVLFLVGVSALAILIRKRAPYLLFGWLWFLGTLVPMIGIIQVGEQARADRYMYIPIIGILVMVVWGAAQLLRRYGVSFAWGATLSVFIVVVLSVLTYRQVGLWKNSETLWNYTISVTRDNFMAEDNLAQELATQGRTEEALVHFHRILNLHNWRPSDLIAFGVYEQRNGYAADAVQQYQRALQGATDSPTRAAAFTDMGSAYLDTKDLKRAEQSFNSALQLEPNNVQALIGNGLVLQRQGQLELAIEQYQRALANNPTGLGYELLARALDQIGRSSDATVAYQRAQALSRDYQSTRAAAEHLLAK